ncbi:chitinase [Citrobacter portucalensis]|uniref:chitinase n=1 Tax=Citrobacter portucalensis TaxID=1639133 RepID=UPI00226B7C2A|nr:chitinase [Citrobacter portucalensis]MCX8980956.1 chitinase [Citrobacter portucalensis]
MAVQQINWQWGSENRIKFNPATDMLDFGWMQNGQFTIAENNGSVVISLPSNNQSYVLDGVSLSQLSLSNIQALDAGVVTAWRSALGGNTAIASESTPTKLSTETIPLTSPTQELVNAAVATGPNHVQNIDWNWGANTHVAFNPATDTLNFNWMQEGQFNVSETNGSVVISIPSNDQSYTLDGVTLSQLSMANINALDSGTVATWQKALGVQGSETNSMPPVSVSIQSETPDINTVPVTGPSSPVSSDKDVQPGMDVIVSSQNNYEFAPYIDMTAGSNPDLLTLAKASGSHDLTLAFLVSDGQGGLSWGGVMPLDKDINWSNNKSFAEEVSEFQKAGGDVILSFGGASGSEAAINAKDAASLATLYQGAIDRYHAKSVDFDIEGGALGDSRANTLRNQAIAILNKNNPDLEISYTLPVLPTGLTSEGTNLLKNAVANNAHVDVVNIMAMDYGGAFDTNGKPDMGDYAIQAAEATLSQMRSAGINDAKVGITPMIGVNDDNKEIFTLEDASQLTHYADSHSDVGRIAMWSLGRDNGSGAGQQWASSSYSGLQQDDYAFSKIFNA